MTLAGRQVTATFAHIPTTILMAGISPNHHCGMAALPSCLGPSLLRLSPLFSLSHHISLLCIWDAACVLFGAFLAPGVLFSLPHPISTLPSQMAAFPSCWVSSLCRVCFPAIFLSYYSFFWRTPLHAWLCSFVQVFLRQTIRRPPFYYHHLLLSLQTFA